MMLMLLAEDSSRRYQVKNPIRAMGYQNQAMVALYADRYRVSLKYATELFEAVKQFLITAILLGNPVSPPPLVDKMWHFFILHTQAYRRFCLQYFGRFQDHEPGEIGPGEVCAPAIVYATLNELFPGKINRRIWDLTAAKCRKPQCRKTPGGCRKGVCRKTPGGCR